MAPPHPGSLTLSHPTTVIDLRSQSTILNQPNCPAFTTTTHSSTSPSDLVSFSHFSSISCLSSLSLNNPIDIDSTSTSTHIDLHPF
ncbi:hypothetical protein PGT21_010613 [Puccinia graminis f. sp. tritici]|uniref:Uncharacterized protein n=1 Tax=Puccinia graminis f. sp. tritici TaxID=56615 RepID=A0A5B0LQF8_PUCGR|nr:hypothetical protein PGT21_010613 [Puccinia graminis f. sp. tritici]